VNMPPTPGTLVITAPSGSLSRLKVRLFPSSSVAVTTKVKSVFSSTTLSPMGFNTGASFTLPTLIVKVSSLKAPNWSVERIRTL